MSKTNGRTGARARANIAPPPTPEELDAARRDAARCKSQLLDLAASHPSAKVWRTRMKAAEAIIARAPKEQ
jgi:hypothetical protein